MTNSMKKLILIITIGIGALSSFAQGIYNTGGYIVSGPGTSWVVSGGNFTLTSESATNLAAMENLTIESDASLALISTTYLTIGGTLQNSGSLAGAASSSVTFTDASAQAINGTGTTTFGNLTVNNTNGLTLADADITVNGTLNFENGLLSTGTHTAQLGASAAITNAGSAKYVNGKLAHTFSSTGSKVFSVGKGGKYRPLTFNYTALTGTSVVTAEQTESAMSGTLPANTTLHTTNRYWTISQTGGTGLSYFVTLDATDYTAANTIVLLKKDASIVSYPATYSAPYYTNTSALSTFSDFALGELNYLVTTSVPKVSDLQVTLLPQASVKWYDAAEGGNFLSLTTPLTTATDYYASQTLNGVESTSRFKVTATVNTCYVTLTTTAVSNIEANTASSGGTISNSSGVPVTASGICWSTTPNPLASGNHTTGATASGSFTAGLTGLSTGTKYYVRAYATNGSGTAYGNEVEFTTP